MKRGIAGLTAHSGLRAVVLGVVAWSGGWGQSAVWQPQGATTGNIYYNGGKVGIGTAAPGSFLEVFGWNALRVGGGNQTPISVQGDSTYHWSYHSIFSNSNLSLGIQSRWDYGATNLILQQAAGNVGIGTTTPQYKLAVNGVIGAKDIIVTNTGWPDYVFRPEYVLRPLGEVEEHIRARGHLPGISSAREVGEKGVSVGEMQGKQLEKVEELTLHVIRQEKENRALRERVERLEGGKRAER